MEVLWRRNPLSAEAITAEVAGPQGWTSATVKTLVNRLLTKSAIEATRDGRRYLYRPRTSRDDYVLAESRRLLDRFFGGRAALLVDLFARVDALSAADIAEIKALIERLDR
jgi:predicted transcriptional regulator